MSLMVWVLSILHCLVLIRFLLGRSRGEVYLEGSSTPFSSAASVYLIFPCLGLASDAMLASLRFSNAAERGGLAERPNFGNRRSQHHPFFTSSALWACDGNEGFLVQYPASFPRLSWLEKYSCIVTSCPELSDISYWRLRIARVQPLASRMRC